MVLKLSFIMIVILKKGMSLMKKYVYVDLDFFKSDIPFS